MSPVEKKRILEQLAEHPGYLLLSAIMQEQVDALQHEILFTRCVSIDMTVQAEYKKGQLEGRLAVEELRKTAIDNLNIDIERIKNESSTRNTGTTNDTADDSGVAP